MILISACLCGINCKYTGGNNINKIACQLMKEGKALPVCPEQLGSLPTPRSAREIKNGTGADVLDGKALVIGSSGDDVTEAFIKGAYETLKIAKACGATTAILKERSPSCGKNYIYDGSFSGKKLQGSGVTAELLARYGIKIFTEENIEDMEI